MSTAIVLTGYCPMCSRQVPGVPSAKHPGYVMLDNHLDQWPWFLCICSGTLAFRRRNR